jgi:hypothetical protein
MVAGVQCEECEAIFTKNWHWQKFCPPVCRARHFARVRNEEVAFALRIKSQINSSHDLFSSVAA